MAEIDIEIITNRIKKFFYIENITVGAGTDPYLVTYRGKLKNRNSVQAFDDICVALEELNLIPKLRNENDKQALIILRANKRKGKSKPRLNVLLFILTLVSVLFTGGLYGYEKSLPDDVMLAVIELTKSGWPFAISMLAILGTHEFGHYFAGKKHGVDVSLPFFIPFPLSLFGTMGAFINMRSLPKNRRALFDLAVTGPLAGFIVSIIALIIGLNLSSLGALPTTPSPESAIQMEGSSLIYIFLKFITFGKIIPTPPNNLEINTFVWWIRYFFTGGPFPWGATDVMLHPVAWAGWAGLFVTAMNLIPVGQLDGGHIFQTVFGLEKAKRIFPFIISILFILGFFWNGWWMWAALMFFMGRRYAEPLDQITDLDPRRKMIGYIACFVFIFSFIPVPIMIIGL